MNRLQPAPSTSCQQTSHDTRPILNITTSPPSSPRATAPTATPTSPPRSVETAQSPSSSYTFTIEDFLHLDTSTAASHSISTLTITGELCTSNQDHACRLPKILLKLYELHSLENLTFRDLNVGHFYDSISWSRRNKAPDQKPSLTIPPQIKTLAMGVINHGILIFHKESKCTSLSTGFIHYDQTLSIPPHIERLTTGELRGTLTFKENSQCTYLRVLRFDPQGSLTLPACIKTFETKTTPRPQQLSIPHDTQLEKVIIEGQTLEAQALKTFIQNYQK